MFHHPKHVSWTANKKWLPFECKKMFIGDIADDILLSFVGMIVNISKPLISIPIKQTV